MQWINLLQNNRSVFQMAFAFVVSKTGPIYLVLVGLMAGGQVGRRAGGQAGRQAGRQADKNFIVLNFLNVIT